MCEDFLSDVPILLLMQASYVKRFQIKFRCIVLKELKDEARASKIFLWHVVESHSEVVQLFWTIFNNVLE